LWGDANRAVLHTGYAVSKDLMDGKPDASAGEGTAWTISTGHEVLLTVWWIRLKRTPVTSRDTFAALITMEPEDYVALQSAPSARSNSQRRTTSRASFSVTSVCS
jgi:hypothetical protein